MTRSPVLDALDEGIVLRLAAVLEAGALPPAYSKLALQRYVGQHAEAVAAYLNELHTGGLAPGHIAMLLKSYTQGRQVGGNPTDWIDVVVTGPDAADTARDTSVVVRQLFNEMKQRVLVVGFVVYQGREVFRRLAERLDSDAMLSATLCVEVRRQPTDTALSSMIVSRFAENFIEKEWPGKRGPRIFYDPRSLESEGSKRSALHAKCVVVDGAAALVTSANFTEAAQQRNIELGLLVRSTAIASQIEQHFESLIKNESLVPLPLPGG